jgi:hypothetical protein
LELPRDPRRSGDEDLDHSHSEEDEDQVGVEAERVEDGR